MLCFITERCLGLNPSNRKTTQNVYQVKWNEKPHTYQGESLLEVGVESMFEANYFQAEVHAEHCGTPQVARIDTQKQTLKVIFNNDPCFHVVGMALENRRMWLTYFKVWILTALVLVMSSNAEDDNIVDTKQGKVRGIQLSMLSGSVTAFLGIPYAEPPIGTLRFKKPVPRKPWTEIRQATEFGKSCYQNKDEQYYEFPGTAMWLVNNEMSEDCLHLNIWVPTPKPKNAPVMVFIHGGAFISGTTSLDIYDGSVLAYAEDVIVVSMNYRMGVLGFLALPGNANAPGNAALFDQRLALQWVQENIEAFGGDPESVTIFGHSAGAACVSYHMICSGSHQYFSRAIIQSGSAMAYWAINSHERARSLTLKLAKLLKCPLEDDATIIDCLQKQDIQNLIDKQIVVETEFSLTLFIPIIDNDFIKEDPKNLARTTLKQADIFIGMTLDDGNPFPLFGAPGFNRKNESLITTAQLEDGLRLFFPQAGDLGIESIRLLYTDWEDVENPLKNREALEQILRDYYFTCPMKQFVTQATKHGNRVFLYEYNYRYQSEVWPEWMGVIHGAELPIIFGKPLIDYTNYTNAEVLLSKRIMKFWGNFARNGAPTTGKEEFIWPQYTRGNETYVVLKEDTSEVHQKFYSRLCQFWNVYLPKLLRALDTILPGCRQRAMVRGDLLRRVTISAQADKINAALGTCLVCLTLNTALGSVASDIASTEEGI
ncbi:cholinesterase-like [Pelodytes ibericus]